MNNVAMKEKGWLTNWVKRGLVWGFFMFIVMAIGFPLLEKSPITWCGIAVKLVVWMVVGLGYGYVTHQWIGTKKNISKQEEL
jgi:hypothetical protein